MATADKLLKYAESAAEVKAIQEAQKAELIKMGFDMEGVPFAEYLEKFKSGGANYAGYMLKTGTYKTTSATGSGSTSLSLTMGNGCIPLSAYVYSKYRVGEGKTVSHTIGTNKSTAINTRVKGDASGDWYESSFNADLTQGMTLEEMKQITTVTASRSSFQYEDFSLTITKWLEPIQ